MAADTRLTEKRRWNVLGTPNRHADHGPALHHDHAGPSCSSFPGGRCPGRTRPDNKNIARPCLHYLFKLPPFEKTS